MRAFAALVLAAATTASAQAAIVKYEFTATVSSMHEVKGGVTIRDVASSSLAGPTISIGDTWTGAFFYDTDLELASWHVPPEDIDYHVYEGYVASSIQDANTGLLFDSKLSAPIIPQMHIIDSVPGTSADTLQMITYDANEAGLESGSFYFADFHGTAFPGAVPPGSLDLADFEFASVSYSFMRNDNFDSVSAMATITSLTPTDALPPVPEPSTYAMLGLGLAALAMTKRLRRA